MLWQAVIQGETASKSNSRKLVTINGKPAVIKGDKARRWVEDAGLQLMGKRPQEPFDCDLGIDCHIFYASRRPDLDESLVMDLLQQARIIKNDRLIREKHIYGAVDRANPRVEIVLFRVAA